MRRFLIGILLAAAVGAGAWQVSVWRNQPVEVPFARAIRETMVSSVPTNGKVEPVEWAVARAERSGAVTRILVRKGQRVAQGDALVELDSTEAQTDLASANSRITQIRSELEVLNQGGRSTDLAVRGFWATYAQFMGIEPANGIR